MKDRSFVFIVANFKHKKYGDEYPVVLLNRKMLMPEKYMSWQGKIGCFGGAVENGETPEEAIHRELQEEMGMGGQDISFLQSVEERHYFVLQDNTIFTQDVMTWYAGMCCEGLLDVFDSFRLQIENEENFIFPEIKQIAFKLLTDRR